MIRAGLRAGMMGMLLIFLASLSDVPSVTAPAAFQHAEQAYLHGYLDESQNEAERGYHRFLKSDPGWARKFQLLASRAMAWRGFDEDVLKLLADDRIAWTTGDDETQRLIVEGGALTRLHRLPEASRSLRQAERLCAGRCSSYGSLLRAQAKYLMERGQVAEAKQVFLRTLQLAQASKDGLTESSALLSLGYIASRQERHDEALDLYRQAYTRAVEAENQSNAGSALGDEGWEQYRLGNLEKALEAFDEAESHAETVGNIGDEITWTTAKAQIFQRQRQLDRAKTSDLQVIGLAEKIGQQQSVINASMDLAKVYIELGRADDAARYANQAQAMAQETGSEVDLLNVRLIEGQAAALRHDWPAADTLLHQVSAAAESQPSMKLDAENALGNIYEAQGQPVAAERSYRAALASVEAARADLKREESQLNFLFNATRIYNDYIHFLVTQGRTEEALEAADWSRARTLQQGLGLVSGAAVSAPPQFRAMEIARRANATLLFYWMGARESYLWAISGEKTMLIRLPPGSEIAPVIERYRRALLNLKDPLKDGTGDGRDLYQMLVAPAQSMLSPARPVVLFADGPMSQMNFETLVVGSGRPHYWIEDATLLSAPSIRMFGAAKPGGKTQGKLLLLGDSISPGKEYPELPMAALEVRKLRVHASASDGAVFTREKATPRAYLASKPEQFAYIHFVSHGTASSTDPLESAVILSRGGAGEDSYKLYARDILRHPIDARLVTISACNSSGTKEVAGEGLVGLSWAFLRAGAHNAIGSLWEVSDASTPELMDDLYNGLEQGQTPADALRSAKLKLLHSGSNFEKPFYWNGAQ